MGDQGSSLKVSIRQLTCGVCSPGHTEPPAAPPPRGIWWPHGSALALAAGETSRW